MSNQFRRWSQTILILFVASVAPSADAQSLVSPVVLGVGDTPVFVTVRDFDNDGHNDITASNYFNFDISVFFGNGDGSFSDEVFFVAGNPSGAPFPTSQAVADFDGDGDLDIAVGLGFQPFIGYLVNNGERTFGPAIQRAIPMEASDLVASDTNGDGAPDLVMIHGQIDQITTLLGNGDGTFGPPIASVDAPRGSDLHLVDITGDGVADALVVSIFENGFVRAYRGEGDGTFTPLPNIPTLGLGPIKIGTHDINGDGYLDVAVTNFLSGTVSVTPGVANGGFGEPSEVSSGVSSDGLGIADVNGDGAADLIVGTQRPTSVSVLLGDGTGAFSASQKIQVAGDVSSIATGDLNGDGISDVVANNAISESITVLFASGSTNVCTGDCDSNGVVDFADLVAMLFRFGGTGTIACDADNSGAVSFADLVATLFHFGPCDGIE